jgi:hypothetical protein
MIFKEHDTFPIWAYLIRLLFISGHRNHSYNLLQSCDMQRYLSVELFCRKPKPIEGSQSENIGKTGGMTNKRHIIT